mmetsp:Transcript_11938/g.30186  ORF Transcript_11938/g.30186 Transcript_11938/m.30186 type:complete len:409 (+) Transcript_11938:3507-4733(+)
MSASTPTSTPTAVSSPLADLSSPTDLGSFTRREVWNANVNAGMPLEVLDRDITPTGLHYVLSHFDVPSASAPDSWRLCLTGPLFRSPLEINLRELKARPCRTLRVTLECAGNGRSFMHPHVRSQPWLDNGVSTAEWTGCSLADLLRDAKLDTERACELLFRGEDRGVLTFPRRHVAPYERSLPLAAAMNSDVLLVYSMNGSPLEPQHGAPVRLLVPGYYGMASVKWVREIRALDKPFLGLQMLAYRIFHEVPDPADLSGAIAKSHPCDEILVKALLKPPGYPLDLAQDRILPIGPEELGAHRVLLEGRAWVGAFTMERKVVRVEVSVDDGAHWADAVLEPASGRYAWVKWTFWWTPHELGKYSLSCRAHDNCGNTQPRSSQWNFCNVAVNEFRSCVVEVIPADPDAHT